MLQVQQRLQHRVGPEEAHRGLWEDLSLHVRMSVRQQARTAVAHLQDRTRDSYRIQVWMCTARVHAHTAWVHVHATQVGAQVSKHAAEVRVHAITFTFERGLSSGLN